jgi:DNA topoisomerase-1
VKGAQVHFHFRAKSGKIRDININDKRLSRIIRRCQELPGQELFRYRGANGKTHEITSSDVNSYIAELSGGHFTAKDFRTWCGTLKAFELIQTKGAPEKMTERVWRKRHLEVIRGTAEYLGNTPSICEK